MTQQHAPGASPEEPKLSAAEFRRRRRGRNLALLVVLVGLCVLFFAITILKRAGTG